MGQLQACAVAAYSMCHTAVDTGSAAVNDALADADAMVRYAAQSLRDEADATSRQVDVAAVEIDGLDRDLAAESAEWEH